MLKANYIQTMDFTFENVNILNCKNKWKLEDKIKNNSIIEIQNGTEIEYINSSYIMFYKLEEK